MMQAKQMKETYRYKVEDVRFVRQKCADCGKEFVVVYCFKDKGMFYFGKQCNCNGQFHPVEGPTFVEWYNAQMRLREAVSAMG